MVTLLLILVGLVVLEITAAIVLLAICNRVQRIANKIIAQAKELEQILARRD